MHEMTPLQAAHALGSSATRGAFGANRPDATTVRLGSVTGFCVAQASARRGRSTAFAQAVASRFGIALPGANRCATTPGLAILSAGPGRWLFVTREPLGGDAFGEVAISFDMSGSRAMFTLDGPTAAAVLAKGTSIDLHESRFGAGSAALTRIGHFSAAIWRPGVEPRYLVLVARSFAQSFWEWLVLAGEEFGGTAGNEEAFE